MILNIFRLPKLLIFLYYLLQIFSFPKFEEFPSNIVLKLDLLLFNLEILLIFSMFLFFYFFFTFIFIIAKLFLDDHMNFNHQYMSKVVFLKNFYLHFSFQNFSFQSLDSLLQIFIFMNHKNCLKNFDFKVLNEQTILYFKLQFKDFLNIFNPFEFH